ncbi:NAD(P)/FAD-dependent oxidoreductase [Nocardioides sp.]|uniref:NAD(P)/FAD-dependent oxidoreductase n=1 Tax=Nocardioides sp. TaxID=35761 RepID=UPI00378374C9
MSRTTRAADVVVVGAGVIGSAIALELARAGRQVLVVDKGPGAGFGSTSASSAIIRFHYSTFTGVAAAWEAGHLWTDWTAHLGHDEQPARFVRTGMLVLDSRPGPTTDLFDAVGVPWEAWDAEEIRSRVPGIDPGRFGPPAPVDSEEFFADARGRLAGTFTPDAGYVDDPRLAAENLATAARHAGATFLLRHTVTALDGDGPRRWRLTLDGAAAGVVDADVVVNAAGPWSSSLNRLAGVDADFRVSSRPLRQEVHELAAPGVGPVVAVADPDLGTYLRPHGAGRLVVGGMEPECDPFEWLDDPDDADLRPTARVFEAQALRAARRFPDLTVPRRPVGVAGVYDVSPDWTPIYDRVSTPGYYVAMGTSGNQFKNAPLVGQVMAHLVAEVEAGHDHDRDPLTFTAPRTGAVLDLRTWSRLRDVPPGAPTSVMG